MTDAASYLLMAMAYFAAWLSIFGLSRRLADQAKLIRDQNRKLDELTRQIAVARAHIDAAASGYRTRMGRINHRMKRLEKSA